MLFFAIELGPAVFHELLADCFYFGPDRKAAASASREVRDALEASGLKRNATYSEQMQVRYALVAGWQLNRNFLAQKMAPISAPKLVQSAI